MPQHNFLIENNPGRAVRLDFNGALAALAANNSGVIEPPAPFPGMLWLDLSVLPDGLMRQRNQANTGWVNMSGVPAQADRAEVIAGISDTTYVTPAALEERQDAIAAVVPNRLINPVMMFSQEAATLSNATGAQMYSADQWIGNGVSGTTATFDQIQLLTPLRSANRVRLVATAAKAVLAGTDNINIYQNIEGTRWADMRWGYPDAKPVVCRFGFRGPVGTYTFALRSGAGLPNGRSYLKKFTISAAQANQDTEQVFVIPGPTTGGSVSWVTDTTRCLQFLVNLGAVASYTNDADQWLDGSWLSANGSSNGIATVNNTFHLFDCGLYEDVSGVGKLPQWRPPDPTEDLRLCQRYYADAYVWFTGLVTSGLGYYSNNGLNFPTVFRGTPTLTGVSANNASFPATPGTYVLFQHSVREIRTANATANSYFGSVVTGSARL